MCWHNRKRSCSQDDTALWKILNGANVVLKGEFFIGLSKRIFASVLRKAGVRVVGKPDRNTEVIVCGDNVGTHRLSSLLLDVPDEARALQWKCSYLVDRLEKELSVVKLQDGRTFGEYLRQWLLEHREA